MKKTISTGLLIVGIVAAGSASANGYKVPAINENYQDPLPLFSEEKPLTDRDRAALSRAQQWLNADQYPFRDGHRVTYLYEGGQPTVVCAPLKLCMIELEQGERVVQDGVHLGDSARWMVTPVVGAGNRTHIIIKPVEAVSYTHLTLPTIYSV